MDVYGYALFWSATACVVAAVVVCTLVVRYGFTRDADLAGRWGWRPTRVGHGLAAALFGTGIVLAILALTAMPIGGKEGTPGLGHTLRAQLETLRGRLGEFEHAVARLGEEGMRRVRAERAPQSTVDVSRGIPMADGGRAIVGSAPLARTQPAPTVDPRSSNRPERRATRPEVGSVAAAVPTTPVAIVPAAPVVTLTPPRIAPPRIARPDVPASTPPAVERAQAQDREADVGTPREKPEKKDKRERTAVADAKALRPVLIDRLDRAERPTVDRVERPDRVDRGDRVDRPDRIERPDRIDRPDRVERPPRIEIERPPKIEKFERIERGGKR